jgi:hypothetical protein
MLTEVEERDQGAHDNCSLLEEIGWEERSRCQLLTRLPEWEQKQAHSADDQHRDHALVVPLTFRTWRKCKRKQNERNSRTEEQQSKKINVDGEVLDDLPNPTSTDRATHIVTKLLCASLIHEETDEERNEANRQNDSPDTIAPSPGYGSQDFFTYLRSSPHSPEERQIEESRVKSTVEQVGCVSHKDLLQDLHAVEASGPEDLRTGESLDVVRRSL